MTSAVIKAVAALIVLLLATTFWPKPLDENPEIREGVGTAAEYQLGPNNTLVLIDGSKQNISENPGSLPETPAIVLYPNTK